ncbi:FeoA family protein [Yunchengibacter salinarum]|uniref:FeoA family protein n=1 Tax=Yunchengibacter salinarum TaxID=3133399 RepID=UPI0035B6093A
MGAISNTPTHQGDLLALGRQKRGFRATIIAFDESALDSDGIPTVNRLRELGFCEGSHVEIAHESPFGRDPIVVRVDGMTVALRRAEAERVLVEIA